VENEIFEAPRKGHEQRASSYGISYVNAQPAKHEDDEASLAHCDEINDHLTDGLRTQKRTPDGQTDKYYLLARPVLTEKGTFFVL
jgi:hypothetical protein